MSLIYLLVSAAVAQADVPAANALPQATKAKADKQICKSESFVGSRVPRRICKTRSEWDAGREGARDTLNKLGRGGDFQHFKPGG